MVIISILVLRWPFVTSHNPLGFVNLLTRSFEADISLLQKPEEKHHQVLLRAHRRWLTMKQLFLDP